MRLVAAVLAVLGVPLLMVVTAGSAWACSCVATPLDEQVGRGDVVFVGRAVEQQAEAPREIVSSLDPVTWTFTVDRVHRGTAAGSQRVTTARSSASCGSAFTAGRTYLVVGTDVGAAGAVSAGAVSTGLCDGTRPVSALTPTDDAVLGEGTVPAPPVPAPFEPVRPSVAWFGLLPAAALLGAALWWYRRRSAVSCDRGRRPHG